MGPMIDATGLRVMRAIADEGSFTAAALALGYSQPAVSQMVKRLEQRTGTVLVEKVGRSVRLTEAGAVLARHATPVLAALDAAEEEVAAIAGLRSGRVRLMAFPSSSVTLVPRALAAVRAEHPDLSVQFTEAEPPESLTALRAGEVDLAVAFSYDGSELARGEEPFAWTPAEKAVAWAAGIGGGVLALVLGTLGVVLKHQVDIETAAAALGLS